MIYESEKNSGKTNVIDRKIIADKMLMLRLHLELTQCKLAEELDLDTSTVRQYENGMRIPQDLNKLRIANYFGLTVQEIFYSVQPLDLEKLKKSDPTLEAIRKTDKSYRLLFEVIEEIYWGFCLMIEEGISPKAIRLWLEILNAREKSGNREKFVFEAKLPLDKYLSELIELGAVKPVKNSETLFVLEPMLEMLCRHYQKDVNSKVIWAARSDRFYH